MWLHLGAPFWIEHTRLKDDDLHPDISSQLLIKDETLNPMATPKFAYLYACSLIKILFLDVSSKSNYLDNRVLESLDFFLF